MNFSSHFQSTSSFYLLPRTSPPQWTFNFISLSHDVQIPIHQFSLHFFLTSWPNSHYMIPSFSSRLSPASWLLFLSTSDFGSLVELQLNSLISIMVLCISLLSLHLPSKGPKGEEIMEGGGSRQLPQSNHFSPIFNWLCAASRIVHIWANDQWYKNTQSWTTGVSLQYHA